MNITRSSSKPSISSSPGRPEKFQPPPPPLTRFLRTNASNRSRGRSLSSPMFSSVVLRKKKSDIETQEPTSPKVTCIGQVRVRRSSKPKPKPKPSPNQNPNPTKTPLTCKWLQRFLFCTPFSRKPKKPYNPFWHRWFKGYHHRKVPQVLEHSSRRDFNFNFNPTGEEAEEAKAKQASIAAVVGGEDEKEESSVFAPRPSSPPKNALLLMRCRSAPHRSGNRLGTASLSLSPAAGGAKEAEREEEGEEDDEEKMAQLGASSRPLILTRCKSEPASRSGTKMALVDICQPHVFFD